MFSEVRGRVLGRVRKWWSMVVDGAKNIEEEENMLGEEPEVRIMLLR
jgi:hypothetical protein